MRLALLAFAALSAGACAAGSGPAPSAPAAPSIVLRNAGFESPPQPAERCPAGWSCTMHSNSNAFRFTLDETHPAEGARSLCIERVIGEPWAVASQAVPVRELRGRRLRFSIAMRAEALDGAGAGPWLLVNGVNGSILHEERVEKLGSRWERRTIEFTVPAQAEGLDVGATLIGGGRVCLDDARLEPA